MSEDSAKRPSAGEPFDGWMALSEKTRTASKFVASPVDPKILSQALRDATVRALAERNYRIAWTRVTTLRDQSRSGAIPLSELQPKLIAAEQICRDARTLLLEIGGDP
jgi:hypothetical protein